MNITVQKIRGAKCQSFHDDKIIIMVIFVPLLHIMDSFFYLNYCLGLT